MATLVHCLQNNGKRLRSKLKFLIQLLLLVIERHLKHLSPQNLCITVLNLLIDFVKGRGECWGVSCCNNVQSSNFEMEIL